jgi:hypothetical protein
MTTTDDMPWIVAGEESKYRLAMIEAEMALAHLIEAWSNRTPLRPYLEQGKNALQELQRLRIQGYYAIICREPSKLEPISEAIADHISLTATEKKQGNHSVLHYELEQPTVNVSTEGHKLLPYSLTVYASPFHQPSDGGPIKIAAHLVGVSNKMAEYSVVIDRSDS